MSSVYDEERHCIHPLILEMSLFLRDLGYSFVPFEEIGHDVLV
jgi:hypothetical protein